MRTPKRAALLDRLLLEEARHRVAALEQLVERDAGHELARGELHEQVDRVRDSATVRAISAVLDRVLDRQRQAQRDLVTGHELLTADRHLLAPHVDDVHLDLRFRVRPQRVAARRAATHESALHVLQAALVLANDHVDVLVARDHRDQLVR